MTTGKFPLLVDPSLGEDELVSVATPNLSDFNGDGKLEFIIFNGHCVEGPCMGNHYLIQVDHGHLIILYSLTADSLWVEGHETLPTIVAIQSCFTFDFGIAFQSVYGFELKSQQLQQISPNQLLKKIPEVIKSKLRTEPQEKNTPNQQAYENIQKIILSIYDGDTKEKMLSSLQLLLSQLPTDVNGEKRLPVHCDPVEFASSLYE